MAREGVITQIEKTDFLTRSANSLLFSQALQEKRVSKKTYFEKLRDPRWQKKRLEVMQNNDFACEKCGDSENTLNVHHKYYFKGREPWEYEAEQLALLCENCHEEMHSEESFLKLISSYVHVDGPYGETEIGSLIAGYMGLSYDRDMQPHIKTDGDDLAIKTPDASMESFYLGHLSREIGNALPWNKYVEINKTSGLACAISNNRELFKNMLTEFLEKVSK
ncbi:MAG: hypothetical protein V4536_08680 [Pseudomonadota bacterium]